MLAGLSLAVVGAQYANDRGPSRIYGISLCRTGDAISLVREPKNPADPQAVAVFAHDIQIGYLTAERAPWIGEMIANGREIEAQFQEATPYGCVIRVAFDGAPIEMPAPRAPKSADTPDFYPDEKWPDE